MLQSNDGTSKPIVQNQCSNQEFDGVDTKSCHPHNTTLIIELSQLDYEKYLSNRIWTICLGLMAFADFCAAMARRHHSKHVLQQSSLLDTVVDWLCIHSDILGIAFSLLWFIDSFVGAHQKRLEAARNFDKQKLLQSKFWDDDVYQWWRGSQGIYFRAIAMQLLLLPVGFLVLCYSRLLRLINPLILDDSVVTVYHHSSGPIPDESEIFSTSATVSLGFAILKHTAITLARRTNNLVQLQAMEKTRKLGYTLLMRGLRHPFQFNRRFRFFLCLVRWFQYLGPLFGTANKLKGNVNNLLMKIKQRRMAAITEKVRRKAIRNMSINEMLDYYATMIQKVFRSKQVRRKIYFLKILQKDSEIIAALKLQRAFRLSLTRARERLTDRLKTLQELKEKERDCIKCGIVKMSAAERRRMYLLQEELESKANVLINEKLLLRPNTRFAVAWKFLFVLAVVFEISILACKPLLARHIDNTTGKQLELENILEHYFIPTPVLQQVVCTGKKESHLKLTNPIETVQWILKKITRRQREPEKPLPWYCQGSYPRIQAVYIYFANLTIHRFLVLVSIIMFMDVYVEFFTGKYDVNTGRLIPPPFFERYIFPGLLLQLLVNPEMDTIANMVLKAILGLIHHDPIRILRWTLALFYPLCMFVMRMINRLWLSYVTDQNQEYLLRAIVKA